MQATHRTKNDKTRKKLQSKRPQNKGISPVESPVLLLGNLSYGWGLRLPLRVYWHTIKVLQEYIRSKERKDVYIVLKVDPSLVSFPKCSFTLNPQHVQQRHNLPQRTFNYYNIWKMNIHNYCNLNPNHNLYHFQIKNEACIIMDMKVKEFIYS